MSWLIERNKKQDKYKLWSTITDSYIIDIYLNRNEMIDFIGKELIIKLSQELKELRATFPRGWTDKDTKKRFNYRLKLYNEIKKIRE